MATMGEDFVLRGEEMPYPIPDVSIGAHCYERLKAYEDGFVLLIEVATGREVTAQELLQLSVNSAAGLKQLGIGKDDAVCLIGRNGVEISAVALGTIFLGGIMAPLDPSMKPFEYQHMFNLIEPKLVFCDSDIISDVQQGLQQWNSNTQIITFQEGDFGVDTFQKMMIESGIDDCVPEPCDSIQEVCLIVGSSGSTGLPKGVALSHQNMLFESILGRNMLSKFDCSTDFLHTSHFFWVSGLFQFFTSVCEGMKRVVVGEVDDITVLKAIQDYKPYWCTMAPSLVNSLVHCPEFSNYDLSSMGLVVTAGSPLQRATIELIKELWGPEMLIAQAYGLSELSGCYLAVKTDMDPESVGSANPGTSIKVVDVETGENLPPGEEGELYCKSLGLMKGYLKNPEATAECVDEDGWLHTGDLGYISPEGAVYITGRIKELMKLDNHQIAPAEIEQLIHTVTGVADVGVAGIKISEDSSHPMALVVKTEDSGVSEEEIVKIVNENLSDFKQLRAGVCFVDSIPRTMTGKIKRRLLQELGDQLYMGDTKFIL